MSSDIYVPLAFVLFCASTLRIDRAKASASAESPTVSLLIYLNPFNFHYVGFAGDGGVYGAIDSLQISRLLYHC